MINTEPALTARRLRAVAQLELAHALDEILCGFGARDIRPLLLKGPAFAQWLYDDPVERPYGDLDLLVAPHQFDLAGSVLTELGFRCQVEAFRRDERPAHHDRWTRHGRILVYVELHRSLKLLYAPPAQVWTLLAEGAGEIAVGATRVAVPREPACALIVALHSAQHGVRDQLHMVDLRQALSRVSLETWRAALDLAKELGAVEPFAAGLQLDPLGRELASRLALPAASPSRLIRLFASTPPGTPVTIERLVSAPGMRARLGLLGRVLLPSSALMRTLDPLARRGRLGLIGAYLRRPLLLALNLRRGLPVWVRVATARPSLPGTTERRVKRMRGR